MKRLFALTGISVLIYFLLFGALVDRPLSLGVLRLEILQKTARLAQLPSPKLVILAGSNGPYSHSCVIIGGALNLPCENAGIAVGIGLDELFGRYEPYLRPGDIVYMPMETQQYVLTRAQIRAGADDGILARHDRWLLTGLPVDRVLGAAFCCDLADLMESLAEMPIAQAGLIVPKKVLAAEYDREGDRFNTPAAGEDPALFTLPRRIAPAPADIRHGFGAQLIARFTAAQTARGVIVIGGLPTDFDDAVIPPATLAAIAAIYTANGGLFAVLPNHSEYPRTDFYDSEDHLSAPYQQAHSRAIAKLLETILKLQKSAQPKVGGY